MYTSGCEIVLYSQSRIWSLFLFSLVFFFLILLNQNWLCLWWWVLSHCSAFLFFFFFFFNYLRRSITCETKWFLSILQYPCSSLAHFHVASSIISSQEYSLLGFWITSRSLPRQGCFYQQLYARTMRNLVSRSKKHSTCFSHWYSCCLCASWLLNRFSSRMHGQGSLLLFCSNYYGSWCWKPAYSMPVAACLHW